MARSYQPRHRVSGRERFKLPAPQPSTLPNPELSPDGHPDAKRLSRRPEGKATITADDSFWQGAPGGLPGRRAGRGPKKAPPPEEASGRPLAGWLRETVLLALAAVLTAVLVTAYVIQAFYIPSASMENTLMINDRVLVNKLVYRFSEPRYRDIVVFASTGPGARPKASRSLPGRVAGKVAAALGLKSSVRELIKRVIAIEGQTVEVRLGRVFVDGKELDEPYRKDSDPMPDFPAVQVPGGSVFVMGDNRAQSGDSRIFGPVPESAIAGRAFALIWPPERLRWLSR